VFFHNFNVFIACLILLGGFAAKPVVSFLSLTLGFFWPAFKYLRLSGGFIYPAVDAVFAILLFFCWYKIGLVPAVRHPKREFRYFIGHCLIAFGSVFICSPIIALILASFPHYSNLAFVAFFLWPIAVLGLIAMPIGLLMIWGSRT